MMNVVEGSCDKVEFVHRMPLSVHLLSKVASEKTSPIIMGNKIHNWTQNDNSRTLKVNIEGWLYIPSWGILNYVYMKK